MSRTAPRVQAPPGYVTQYQAAKLAGIQQICISRHLHQLKTIKVDGRTFVLKASIKDLRIKPRAALLPGQLEAKILDLLAQGTPHTAICRRFKVTLAMVKKLADRQEDDRAMSGERQFTYAPQVERSDDESLVRLVAFLDWKGETWRVTSDWVTTGSDEGKAMLG